MNSTRKGISDAERNAYISGKMEERRRIRRELEDWLIGRIDPRDAGLHNSRRIVDEINRICPKT